MATNFDCTMEKFEWKQFQNNRTEAILGSFTKYNTLSDKNGFQQSI